MRADNISNIQDRDRDQRCVTFCSVQHPDSRFQIRDLIPYGSLLDLGSLFGDSSHLCFRHTATDDNFTNVCCRCDQSEVLFFSGEDTYV